MLKGLVIGDGALGVAAAYGLAQAGVSVGMVGRSGPQDVHGTLVPADGAPAVSFAYAALTPAAADFALVAVKAFDLEGALRWTTGLQPGTPVIPLANGAVWHVIQSAADQAPQLVWRIGFATLAVSVLDERRYALRSADGEISFGPASWAESPEPTAVESKLTAAAKSCVWHSNIQLLARRKWLYNTVINSLTASRGLMRNGDLLVDLPTVAAVFSEAWALAEELWGPWGTSRDGVYAGLLKLVEKTAENENSMARDRRLGRRTESAFLAGLAADARRYPLLAALHREVG